MTEADPRSSLVPAWFVAHRRPIVLLVVVLLTALAVAATALGFAARPGAQPFAPQNPVVYVGSAAVIAAYGFVFALLVMRVPGNALGWIFGAFALIVAISNFAWGYLTYVTSTIPPLLPGAQAAGLVVVALLPFWSFLLICLVTLFPDGRSLSRAWGRLVVAAFVVAVVASLSLVFAEGPSPVYVMPTALTLSGAAGEALSVAGTVLVTVLVFMIAAAVWSLTIRYRAADDIGRLQLKWLVYAGGILAVCSLVFWIMAGSAYEPGSGGSTGIWLVLCLGGIVVPLAALIAILRYRLYEIETIISRTLVYGLLTAILAGMYAAGIRLFNSLFVSVTGENSDAALVLTTLILATTFTPIKSWLESKVAARRRVIVDPSMPVSMERGDGDADIDRIAERAAGIVLRRLAESNPGVILRSESATEPGRATLE
jgi:hypothetical protein